MALNLDWLTVGYYIPHLAPAKKWWSLFKMIYDILMIIFENNDNEHEYAAKTEVCQKKNCKFKNIKIWKIIEKLLNSDCNMER